MKNSFNLKRLAIYRLVQETRLGLTGFRLGAALAVSFLVLGVAPHVVSQAQRHDTPNKVWNVAAQPSGDGTVVWITADAP